MLRSAFIVILLIVIPASSLLAQDAWVISNVILIGNDRTKDFVVERELPFHQGDTIPKVEFEKVKASAIQSLTNTSLFNFVEINEIEVDESHLILEVKLQERWYIWPGILFSLAETNISTWWQSKDFSRINYGFYIQDQNFRGRREVLTFNFQYGWTRKAGLNYYLPGINKKRTIGLGFDVYYANNREINYGSAVNERLFFKEDRFIQEEFSFMTQLEYRPRIFNRHRFAAGMNTVIVDDSVITINSDYLPSDLTRSQYLQLRYGFKREMRDNIGYPLTGYVIDLAVDQDGLNLVNDDDIFMTTSKFTLNMHHHLGGRWYFAHGFKGKYTLLNPNQTPYYYQRGLGYGNAFIRGYELYVIDGQHFGLYKSNIKYQLIKKRSNDLVFGILDRFDKFHYSVFLNVFADAGYVVDNINAQTNPFANEWQYSAGLGLDFATYYDIVIRFETAVNRLGEPGFYIHFTNPI